MNEKFRFLLYKVEQEDISVDALIKDETIWLTQKAMAELFEIDKSGISRHLKNIFESGELDENVVVAKIAIPTKHGAIPDKEQLSPTNYYNLDAIISVGYRVDSIRATHFRKWATSVLKEYMIKGFAIDDERLKQGKTAFGKDYFKELLERIRSIRASERRICSRLPIFMRNAVLTTIKMHLQQRIFMQWCKINFTMRLQVKRVRKLCIRTPITKRKIWV